MNEGWHKVWIEADYPIGRSIKDFAEFELHIDLVALLLAEHQTEVRPGTTDLAAGVVAGVGVGDLRLIGGIARQDIRLLRTTCFDVVARHQRQGQVDRGVAGIGRHIQDQRLGVATQLEQAAIRQDARGLADHQLAHVEKLQVDFQSQKPPAIAAQQLGAGFHLVVIVTIVVLEVLRAQQHAFLPDDFMHIHGYLSALTIVTLLERMLAWSRVRSASFSACAVSCTT
ncbi:hypothetical protein D3C72_1334860 [compost metagenome]